MFVYFDKYSKYPKDLCTVWMKNNCLYFVFLDTYILIINPLQKCFLELLFFPAVWLLVCMSLDYPSTSIASLLWKVCFCSSSIPQNFSIFYYSLYSLYIFVKNPFWLFNNIMPWVITPLISPYIFEYYTFLCAFL